MVLTRPLAFRHVVKHLLGNEETRRVNTLHIRIQCNGDAKGAVTSLHSVYFHLCRGSRLIAKNSGWHRCLVYISAIVSAQDSSASSDSDPEVASVPSFISISPLVWLRFAPL